MEEYLKITTQASSSIISKLEALLLDSDNPYATSSGIRQILHELESELCAIEEESVYSVILQALGHASVCWDSYENAGNLQTEELVGIAHSVCLVLYRMIGEETRIG